MKVTVYTTGAGCMACRLTKKRMRSLGINFDEKELSDDDRSASLEMGYTTSPVVQVSRNGIEYGWDGYRPDRIDDLAR